MALKSAFRVELIINNKNFGLWDAFTGGDWDMTETKYTPADGIQRTYVGMKTTNNITVETDYNEAVHGELTSNHYRGDEAEVIVYDLDSAGKFQQNRTPYKGLVKQVVPPDGDSNDASTVVRIQVIISVGTPAGASE